MVVKTFAGLRRGVLHQQPVGLFHLHGVPSKAAGFLEEGGP